MFMAMKVPHLWSVKKSKVMRLTITSIFFMIFFTSGLLVKAQTTYGVDASKSKIEVNGSSTLHDWEEQVTSLSGEGQIAVKDNVLASISSLKVTIPVKAIKSEHTLMDNNTYEALKNDDYPNITFVLTRADISGANIKATGNLTIAGKTRSIEIAATYQMLPNGTMAIKGKAPLKMTDYGVNPPSVMMGTIKCGDPVTIDFDLILKQL